MHALTPLLVPLVITVAVALICWFIVERFSPDPLITQICKIIIFVVVLFAIIVKLLPLIGI